MHNSAVDVGEGLFDPDGQLVATRITEHYPDYHYVKPDSPFAHTHRRIRAAFPSEDVAFTSITTDGAKGVAMVYGDRFPATFYLVDFRTEEIEELFRSRPWLAREDLSPMESVQLKARDGTILHGYLTTPKGWSEGDRLPLIVLVHGGPHGVRDHWGFDPEAQLFASRGFAVLQVNYRGSGGYGKDFLYARLRPLGPRDAGRRHRRHALGRCRGLCGSGAPVHLWRQLRRLRGPHRRLPASQICTAARWATSASMTSK